MMMNEKQLNHSVNSLFEFASHLHGLTTQLIENEKKKHNFYLKAFKKGGILVDSIQLAPYCTMLCSHVSHFR